MIVLPSLDEGFGMPALEAMTIGVPVVVSNRGALPEVVGNAGQIVDPTDATTLTAAMDRLLGDATFARHASEAGKQRARHFSWGSSASALMGAYASAIERRRSRR
jgi:glycosyltransferase involved in cell wall biosynthesis